MGDVSNFLVFLAIVLIGITVIFGTDLGAKIFRKKPSDTPLTDGGFEEPVTSLPPVLLPEEAKPDDVDRVRFALGLRGYRMDQVDQVLDDLRDQLAAKDAEIAGLRAHLRGEIPGSAAKPSTLDGTGFRISSEDSAAPSERPVAEERS
ncbi:DivIVA domain-containing protein [Arthrobacter sp. D1-17]